MKSNDKHKCDQLQRNSSGCQWQLLCILDQIRSELGQVRFSSLSSGFKRTYGHICVQYIHRSGCIYGLCKCGQLVADNLTQNYGHKFRTFCRLATVDIDRQQVIIVIMLIPGTHAHTHTNLTHHIRWSSCCSLPPVPVHLGLVLCLSGCVRVMVNLRFTELTQIVHNLFMSSTHTPAHKAMHTYEYTLTYQSRLLVFHYKQVLQLISILTHIKRPFQSKELKA